MASGPTRDLTTASGPSKIRKVDNPIELKSQSVEPFRSPDDWSDPASQESGSTMVPQDRSSSFVMVTCVCGRSLRAKSDQVDQEIRCWDCHQMVRVRDPHQAQKVARELSDSARNVINGPDLASVIVGSLIGTLLFCIPFFGVWCAAVAFALFSSTYGEIIHRTSHGSVRESGPGWIATLIPRSVVKFLLGTLMAVGTVLPIWYLNAAYHQSPHWDRIGLTIAFVTWVFIPLFMLIVFDRTDQKNPAAILSYVKIFVKHPLALILALAIVPVSLVVVELGWGLMFYLTGNLAFFSLEYMPTPLIVMGSNKYPAVMLSGIPYFQSSDYRTLPSSIFEMTYLENLRHGYSLVGAIPASLSMSTRNELNAADAIGIFEPFYLIIRLFFTLTTLIFLLTAFSIQARWLGLVLRFERPKIGGDASSVSPASTSLSPAFSTPPGSDS